MSKYNDSKKVLPSIIKLLLINAMYISYYRLKCEMLKLYNKKTNVHKLRNRATISLIRKCSIQIDVSIQSTDITFILSYIILFLGGGGGGRDSERTCFKK